MPLIEVLSSDICEKKRKRHSEPGSLLRSPDRSIKRRKANSQRHKDDIDRSRGYTGRLQTTPSAFWDNLSRQWLTRRTLREFDRRTCSLKAPPQPNREDTSKLLVTRLKRFARHGGPDLEDLRSYPKKAATITPASMDSSQSSSRKSSSQRADQSSKTSFTGKKTSVYDPAFEQHLDDHGIYQSGFADSEIENSADPKNLEEINARLLAPRDSLSPSRYGRDDFLKFTRENHKAKNETGVMNKVFPIMLGNQNIPCQQNVEFTNLIPLTDGSLVNAKPDFYDGENPSRENRQLREELGPYIVPASNTSGPCLPNFFAEGKGPDGNSAVAKRQTCYDGAFGARGMHEVRSYANPEDAFDNNAYTITSTYAGGAGSDTLKLYATHVTASADPQIPVEYHMTQLRSFAMTDNLDAFRQGATALRNARDWAKEKREEVIAAANERSNLQISQSFTTDASQSTKPQPDSDTSTDEPSRETSLFTSFASITSLERDLSEGVRSSSKQRRSERNAGRPKKKIRSKKS